MNDIITELSKVIPAAYLPWLLAAYVLFKDAGRAYQAIRNGGGLLGIWRGLVLGTNTPTNSTPPAATGVPAKSGGATAGLFLFAASLLLIHATGCAGIAPGQRAVVVRAEQSITIANSTFDAAVHIDAGNRAFYRTNAPAFHEFCEWLRTPVVLSPLTNSLPRGVAICSSADVVKNAYKQTSGTNEYVALINSLAVVEAATAEAQKFILATKK